MEPLTIDMVKSKIARSQVVYSRGESIFFLGNYRLESEDAEAGQYAYSTDGTYGDYTVSISLKGERVRTQCTCPYPYGGCKHVVAACLDIAHRQARAGQGRRFAGRARLPHARADSRAGARGPQGACPQGGDEAGAGRNLEGTAHSHHLRRRPLHGHGLLAR